MIWQNSNPFVIKLSKLVTGGHFLMLLMGTYEKPIANTILTGKRLHASSLRLGLLATLTTSIQHWTGGSNLCDKLMLKLMGKYKGSRIAKTILEKKITKLKELYYLIITYYKATQYFEVWYQHIVNGTE